MNSYPFGDSVERFLVVVDAILLNRDRVLVAWDVVFLSHVIQGQLVDAVESILFGRSGLGLGFKRVFKLYKNTTRSPEHKLCWRQ